MCDYSSKQQFREFSFSLLSLSPLEVKQIIMLKINNKLCKLNFI